MMDSDRQPKTGIRQIGGCNDTGAWLVQYESSIRMTVSPGNALHLNRQQARDLASALLDWAGDGDGRVDLLLAPVRPDLGRGDAMTAAEQATCRCTGKRNPCCCDAPILHCWWCGRPYAKAQP